MRRAATRLAGVVLAVFLIGASVVPLTIPAFTKYVSQRTSLATEAGLTPSRMTEIAEQVRQFVVDADSQVILPEIVDGRPGFDADAASHLIDVRRVLSGSRVLTGVLALVLATILAIGVAQKRTDLIADVLSAGAIASVVLVVLCFVVAMTNFDWFFSAFHGLLFKSGTWTFAPDSLLIQTFPEPFWTIAGAAWGGLVVAGAALFAAAVGVLRRSGGAPGA